MSTWNQALQRTPDCIPLERFGETLSAEEREHIAHCARCEAELALWRQITDAAPADDEGAAVQWVAAETLRRMKAATTPRKAVRRFDWIRALRPRTLALAATLLIGAAAAYVALRPGGSSIDDMSRGATTYRSGSVRLIAPTGDLDTPPSELQWEPVTGAAAYDVEIREVDRTLVWRESTDLTHVTLPADVRTGIVPARTLLWQVTAKESGGAVIAESETGRFRLSVNASPRKQP